LIKSLAFSDVICRFLCVCVRSAPDDVKSNVGKIESIVSNPAAPNQVGYNFVFM